MANTKDNRRVQYTKTALRKSLLSLLLERPIDRITVKDICAGAGLNRGTFYAHYSSPEQLLAQIENEFYIDLLSEIATFQQAEDVERIFVRALYALRDRRELASALFGPNGDRAFLTRMLHVAHDMCIVQWNSVSPEASRDALEYTYIFISHGVANLIQQWLAAGAQEPPERLAALMNDLCNYGVSASVDLGKITPPVARRFPLINDN